MTGKTKYLSGFAGLVVLGLVFAGIRHRESPSPTLALDQPVAEPVSPLVPPNRNSQSPGFASMDPVSNDPVDPDDWVQNGPKEALVPPEIHVEVELAPESVLKTEPLAPKEVTIDAELAPGETFKSAPLTPPEIHADGSPR